MLSLAGLSVRPLSNPKLILSCHISLRSCDNLLPRGQHPLLLACDDPTVYDFLSHATDTIFYPMQLTTMIRPSGLCVCYLPRGVDTRHGASTDAELRVDRSSGLDPGCISHSPHSSPSRLA